MEPLEGAKFQDVLQIYLRIDAVELGGAATGMRVQDYYLQKRRGWVRLHEKGGKVTELPCHHNLDQRGPDDSIPVLNFSVNTRENILIPDYDVRQLCRGVGMSFEPGNTVEGFPVAVQFRHAGAHHS